MSASDSGRLVPGQGGSKLDQESVRQLKLVAAAIIAIAAAPGSMEMLEPAEVDGVALVFDVAGYRWVLTRRIGHSSQPINALSPREREIANLIAAGHTTKTAAATLGLSCWTVSTYVRRVYSKLGVRTRAAMAARLRASP